MAIPGYVAPAFADGLTPGPTRGIQVNLGSLSLNYVDDSGTEWLLEAVDGWEGADTVGDLVQRVSADGAWDAPRYLGPKVMTLQGLTTAPDALTRERAKTALKSALSVHSLTTMTVYEAVPKRCQVKRAGKLNLTIVGDTQFTWSCVVEAPDPRLYATTSQTVSTTFPDPTGGGVTFPLTFPLTFPDLPKVGTLHLLNDGDIDAPWTAVATGPIDTGWQLWAGQRWIGFDFAVPAGVTATVDVLTGVVTLGGQPYQGRVSRGSSWWLVPPGGIDARLVGSGTGSVAVTTASAWS